MGYSLAVVSELHDVREFLAGRPPFVALPGAALDVLPRHIAVRYLRRGASFPPADASASMTCCSLRTPASRADRVMSVPGK